MLLRISRGEPPEFRSGPNASDRHPSERKAEGGPTQTAEESRGETRQSGVKRPRDRKQRLALPAAATRN